MTADTAAPIVVGVDNSDDGMRAVEWATGEAALRDRTLRIVHALGRPTVVTGGPSGSARLSRARALLTEAQRVAGKAAPDVEAVPVLVVGPAAAALHDQSRGATMVVLGGRGAGGYAGLLVGSVALRVAEHAAAPVVVVRGQGAESGPVVVGVDASPLASQALDFALREASLRGTDLVAVHAWTNLAAAGLDDALPTREESWAVADRAQRMLAEALAGAAEHFPDVKIRRCAAEESPRQLLVSWSRTAQLVVVGAHGYGNVAGLLLGSVSRYLVHRASCPVAVVRPDFLETS